MRTILHVTILTNKGIDGYQKRCWGSELKSNVWLPSKHFSSTEIIAFIFSHAAWKPSSSIWKQLTQNKQFLLSTEHHPTWKLVRHSKPFIVNRTIINRTDAVAEIFNCLRKCRVSQTMGLLTTCGPARYVRSTRTWLSIMINIILKS
jgi:hypothetical protein